MINESKSFNFIRVLIHLVLKKVNLQISDNCKKTKLFLAKFRLKLSAQTSTSSLNTGLKRQKKFFSLDFIVKVTSFQIIRFPRIEINRT